MPEKWACSIIRYFFCNPGIDGSVCATIVGIVFVVGNRFFSIGDYPDFSEKYYRRTWDIDQVGFDIEGVLVVIWNCSTEIVTKFRKLASD